MSSVIGHNDMSNIHLKQHKREWNNVMAQI